MRKCYNIFLSSYFQSKPLYLDGENYKKPNVRKLVEQPWQELEAAKACEKQFEKNPEIKKEREKLWDNVTNTLCNLDFIQAKAAAKLTYGLANEINKALEVIPENVEEIAKEKAHHARMEKYIKDLIACADGKTSRFDLEVPESIKPWVEIKIDTEIKRIKSSTNRADKLKNFKSFLEQEAIYLHNNCYDNYYFTLQQAWNFANAGPVGKAAELGCPDKINKTFLRHQYNRPKWNPKPQLILNLFKPTKISRVNAVTISIDGEKALSGSNDNSCTLWNLETGRDLITLSGHNDSVKAVSITADGKRAISGSDDKSCILWSLSTGEALHKLTEHTDSVNSVAITPNGNRAISGSDDKSCILWDLITGKVLHKLTKHTDSVSSVSITPDGKRAISGSIDKSCILWNLDTGKALHNLSSHKGPIMAVSITPNGRRAISSSLDKNCILWDLDTGKVLKILTSEDKRYEVNAVCITPDGKKAISGSWDGKVSKCRLWDLNTGKILKIFSTHSLPINDVSITPDGAKAISCSRELSCKLWNIESGKDSEQSRHYASVTATAISLDGRLAVSGSRDHTWKLWPLPYPRSFRTYHGHNESITAIDITPDGKRAITGSKNHMCKLWHLSPHYKGNNPVLTLSGHTGLVYTIAITPEGKRAISGSEDCSCRLWDLETGKTLKHFVGHAASVRMVDITPDGKRAVTASDDKSCILWELISGKALKTLYGHLKEVIFVIITPDGKKAISGSVDKSLIQWDLSTGKIINILFGHTGKVTSIAISSDGKRAISGSVDKSCILWDLNTGKALYRLTEHTDSVNSVAITPDGKRAISGSSDHSCILWDLATGKKLAKFTTVSEIENIKYYPGKIFGGTYSGTTFLLQIGIDALNPMFGIVNILRIWDFNYGVYSYLKAQCPFCKWNFDPPKSVVKTIQKITKKAGLTSDQSPYLSLPDKAWEHRGLLSECPKCGETLKFNPFIPGDYKPKPKWKFWKR